MKEYLQKKRAKKELNKCFRQGGIYHKYKRSEKDYFIFPKIHSYSVKSNYNEYVFTLPLGVDPALLDKKGFVFRQLFGERVEVSSILNNDKSFSLKVYTEELPSPLFFDLEEFKKKAEGCDIPIIMGCDMNGEWNVFDLKKYHHVQITGTTNMGKSLYLRSILVSLILTFSPEQVHFYLADLKRVELTLFKKIQHTKKTVTNLPDLEFMLQLILIEVERRYSLMEKHEVAHMDEVNELLDKPIPHIVIMIDEYGLCSESNEILKLVQDITSIARAANVYLFLSLQRADSTTITGIAKNNLGVKISFKQSNGINAKIAGVPGVENLKLEDKGLAIMDVGTEIQKIQCPFITVKELKEIIKPYIVDVVQPLEEVQEIELDQNEIFGVLDDE